MNLKLYAVNIVASVFIPSLIISPFVIYCNHFRLSLNFFALSAVNQRRKNLECTTLYLFLLQISSFFTYRSPFGLHLSQRPGNEGCGDKFNFVLSRKRIQMWWTRLLSWKLAKKMEETKWEWMKWVTKYKVALQIVTNLLLKQYTDGCAAVLSWMKKYWRPKNLLQVLFSVVFVVVDWVKGGAINEVVCKMKRK